MSAPRVGVVGARRARHGLGPFVVRDLHASGAIVAGFVATGAASRETSARELESLCGRRVPGYLDVEALLAAEAPDALAILSPSETHERHLEAALEAGVDVLCEKPLVWGGPGLGARARRLAERFAGGDLLLWENCQWVYTLSCYDALHPGALAAPPRRFEMRLSPSSAGRQSLGDALPHALSLLQALLPGDDPQLSEIRFSTRDPEAPVLRIAFEYRAGGSGVAVAVSLRRSESHPREAAYALDGRWARRVVADRDYRLFLADGERRVPLRDPLTALVSDFTSELRLRLREGRTGDALRARAAARRRRIGERAALLDALAAAYEQRGDAAA